MPKEKAQLKCLIKSVEGKETEERTITFVASSAEQDRHYEKVDTASLRLPLKGGGEIIAGDIKADGVDNIDIPLMLNHSFDVKDVIGSVRRQSRLDDKRHIDCEYPTYCEQRYLLGCNDRRAC